MISMKVHGLEELARNFHRAPDTLQDEIGVALGQSLAMAETEAKRRTPLDTGYLRSSIGGGAGFRFVDKKKLRAGVGTNVSYAYWVEVRKDLHHPVGEWGYMQKGAKAAEPFITETMQGALDSFAKSLVK
jgi:hypothetical protein